MGCVASLLWVEWKGMTETKGNSCAQLLRQPKPLCPLLSPSGCAFQRVVIHPAVTVHILELFPLPASPNPSPCVRTDTDHNTPTFNLHNSVFSGASPLLLLLLLRLHISESVSALHSPSLAPAYILQLFLGNCDSQHPLLVMLPALSLYTSHSPVIWLACVGSRPSHQPRQHLQSCLQ